LSRKVWGTIVDDKDICSGQGVDSVDLSLLVMQAHRGDGDAKQELLRRYRPLLAQTIRRSHLTQSSYRRLLDWDDLWQEARYAFLLLLEQYNPTRQVPFGGYVRSLLPWHFRHLQRQIEHQVVATADLDALATVADSYGDFVGVIMLRDVFRHLSPRQAQILEGLYLHDKTVAELATELGVGERAINAARRRAEISLKHVLTREQPQRLGRRPSF